MSVVNVAITDTFVLRDNSNVAITGKVSGDFSVVEAYDIATPGTTAAVTLTEIGSGQYRISFTPPTTGAWASHVLYNSGGVFREYSESYDVQTAAQADPYAASAAALANLDVALSDVLAAALVDPVAAVGLTSALVDNLAFIRPGAVTVSSAVTDDLEIVRGDTFSRPIHLLDQDGEDFDLTGGKAWLTVKRKRDARDDDTDAVIQLYWESGGSSSGITASDEAGGVLVIEMTPSQTDLLHPGNDLYRYDVQAENGSQVGTPIRGSVVVLQDSTRRRTVP